MQFPVDSPFSRNFTQKLTISEGSYLPNCEMLATTEEPINQEQITFKKMAGTQGPSSYIRPANPLPNPFRSTILGKKRHLEPPTLNSKRKKYNETP